MKKLFLTLTLLVVGVLGTPVTTTAQELYNETKGIWRAEVTRVVDTEDRTIPGTETPATFQTINATVLDGPAAGTPIVLEDDYLQLKVGERFYFTHTVFINGSEAYGVLHRDRSGSLLLLTAVFVIAVIALSGWQGVRSLIALGGGFMAIFFILLPGLLAGWNPIVTSLLVAAVVLFGAIFFTHGLNRESLVAYSGTMIAVAITVLFALFAVSITALTGFASEGSVALNFNTKGTLDLSAILLGAIIIGVLGVLDDIAVTQAAVVTELYNSNQQLSSRSVFFKALRVGREHVGALVNTLVFAYTGAALPLLLYYYVSASSVSMALSSELFATEIVRIIVGSVGLILTVPIVTALAVYYLKGYVPTHAHAHGHGHHH